MKTVTGLDSENIQPSLSDERLLTLYELMVLGRILETRLHNLYRGWRLVGAV